MSASHPAARRRGRGGDTAHCGRLIEEKQLKRFAGLATRDGDYLRVSLYPRGEATFRSLAEVSPEVLKTLRASMGGAN